MKKLILALLLTFSSNYLLSADLPLLLNKPLFQSLEALPQPIQIPIQLIVALFLQLPASEQVRFLQLLHMRRMAQNGQNHQTPLQTTVTDAAPSLGLHQIGTTMLIKLAAVLIPFFLAKWMGIVEKVIVHCNSRGIDIEALSMLFITGFTDSYRRERVTKALMNALQILRENSQVITIKEGAVKPLITAIIDDIHNGFSDTEIKSRIDNYLMSLNHADLVELFWFFTYIEIDQQLINNSKAVQS
jgi:hypothetical protein